MISWMDEHNVVEGGDEFLLEFAFATIPAFSESLPFLNSVDCNTFLRELASLDSILLGIMHRYR
jgi:hypothetical protein